MLFVSLPEQLAYVYRNGVIIGASTVSTGKKGRETPAGVFTILQMMAVSLGGTVTEPLTH